MTRLILPCLAGALLSACATCERHPLLCTGAAAIVAGSLALSLSHNPDHTAPDVIRPYHLSKPVRH